MNSQDYQENDFEKEFFISGDNHNSKKLKRVLKSEQYDFFREKIEKEFVRINKMLMKNQTVFVSELYFTILGTVLIDNQIESAQIKNILQYIKSIQISEGGFKPSNANPIFKENYQRIYSTYYALSALNLLGHLDEFKKEKEWNENTITWISSQQTDDGDFFDQISPFSEKIENSFWAIGILKFLGDPLTSSKNIDIEKLIELIKVRLKNKQVESVTNSFYLMILIKSIDEITRDQAKNLIEFVNSVNEDNFFHEFPLDVKKDKYRIDFTESHPQFTIHSTIFAKILLKKLNGESVDSDFLKLFLSKFYSQLGFGSQLKIKKMDFGSFSTTFEIVLLLLFCLSIE